MPAIAMHKGLVGSKVCAERTRQRSQELHKQRLKAVKPTVDTSEPQVAHLNHLQHNLKREQLLEERYFEIDRENKILLQKMSELMRSSSSTGFDRPKSNGASLTRDGRKMELMRVTWENQNLLKRIQKAQPYYNHVEWEDSYRRSGTYMKNRCEYPLPPSARGGMLSPSGGRLSKSGSSLVGRPKSSSNNDMRTTASGARKEPLGGRSAGARDDDLRYVLKEGKKIGATYYLVEMVTDGRTLAISAYDGDTQRTLELVVSEKNHRRLFRETDGDYNSISERLRVEGDQLVLDSTGEAV